MWKRFKFFTQPLGLVQCLQKSLAPKSGLLNLKSSKEGSLKTSTYHNFLEIFEDNRKNHWITQRIKIYSEHTCLFQQVFWIG